MAAATTTATDARKTEDASTARKAVAVTTACLSLAVVLFVSCYPTIPLKDTAFSILFSLYLFLINKIRFGNNQLAIQEKLPHGSLGKAQFLGTPEFTKYVLVAAVSGFFLPAFLVVLLPRSSPLAQHAAPHLFLSLVQGGMEQVTNSPNVHDLPRILVPIGFSVWREWALWTWVEQAYQLYQLGDGTDGDQDSMLPLFGLVLAVFNLAFFSYNLFFFLLLRMTPLYMNPKESPAPKTRWVAYLWPVVEQPLKLDPYFGTGTSKNEDSKKQK